MELNLFPRHCPDEGQHVPDRNIPEGLTHTESEPCPLRPKHFPIGVLGTCCSLHAKVAAYELIALGRTALADVMSEDMTPEGALVFAERLQKDADDLEEANTSDDDETSVRGAGQNGSWSEVSRIWNHGYRSTLSDAIGSIREAADWYKAIGERGFGVRALG